MKTLELEITAEDIAQKRHDGSVCPVACALKRAGCNIPLHVQQRALVFYNSDDRTWDHRKEIGRVALPSELVAFIRAYDNKKPVQPFKFTWTINLPSLDL